MLKCKQEICGQCGACVAVCQFDALCLRADGLEIVPDDCTLCGDCILVCPISALIIENE